LLVMLSPHSFDICASNLIAPSSLRAARAGRPPTDSKMSVQNVQTGQIEHKPIERAKAALEESPWRTSGKWWKREV
jgi:hypothetical protein